jgi:uncharacterized protein YciI
MTHFLVESAKGPTWDHSTLRREQAGWDEHAAFMDALVDDGFIVLGGPIGEGDGENTLLIVEADSEDAVRDRLSADPWYERILRIDNIRPWSIWLRR